VTEDTDLSKIDSHHFKVNLKRPANVDENSSAHAADADLSGRQRNDSHGDSSQFTLSDWQESQITSTFCDSEYNERGEFTAEQLLHYLEVRHNRTSSVAYNELNQKDESL
jgi:hypothetical protein